MTPNSKNTIGCWLVLDNDGSAWLVQCLACQRKTAFPKSLLSGPYPPRCKCGGKVPAKPVEALPVLTRSVVPAKPERPLRGERLQAQYDGWQARQRAKRASLATGAKPGPQGPRPAIELGRVDVEGSRLTVTGTAQRDKQGYRRVQCVCDCGQTCTVKHAYALSGKQKSCGCLQAESMPRYRQNTPIKHARPGDVYGARTVLSEGQHAGHDRTVLCLCTCGTERVVSVRWLLRQTATACVCQAHGGRFGQVKRVAPQDKEAATRYRKLIRLRDRLAGHLRAAGELQAEIDALQSTATVAQ